MARGWVGDAIAVLLLLALVAAVGLRATAARTVYTLDAMEVCAAAILPVEAALLAVALPGGWWGERRGGLDALAGLALLGVLLPVNLALGLNQWGDRSAGAAQRLVVLDRDETVHRGRHSYAVSVAPQARRPLAEGSRLALFDGPKSVAVSRADYERAEPGRSTLTLTLHPGLFGFSWFEDGARLDP